MTWADGAAGKQKVLSYDKFLVAAPVDQLDFKEMVMLNEPELTFIADKDGKISPMASAYMLVGSIQGQATARVFKVLIDSGGTSSMLNEKSLPPGVTVTPVAPQTVNTLAGHMTTKGKVNVKSMRLPEFERNRIIEEHEFSTFKAPCKYDMILGADYCAKVGFKLDYENLEIEWAGIKIPMNTTGFTKGRLHAFIDHYHMQMEEEMFEGDLGEDSYASAILDAKYDPATPEQIVEENCAHLTSAQQGDLFCVSPRDQHFSTAS